MYKGRTVRIDRRLKAQHPDEPWLWKKEWVDKRAVHSHLQDGLVLLGIAMAWNALWGGAIWYMFFEAEDPSPIRWVMLPFAAFGPLLLVGAVRSLYNGIRHPRSTLHLNSVPQPVGQRFTARVQMPSLPEADIRSELLCAMRRTQRSQAEPLWKKEQQALSPAEQCGLTRAQAPAPRSRTSRPLQSVRVRSRAIRNERASTGDRPRARA